MIRRLLIDREDRDKTAVIDGDKRVTYADLIGKALALIPLLPQGQQETVAILLSNGGDYIAAFWGTVQAGMAALPLHDFLTAHEIAPLLRQARVGTIISATAHRGLLQKIAGLCAPPPSIIYIDELAATARGDAQVAHVGPDEPMALLSTSGTTGQSKIVQLSERNVEASVLGYLDKMRLDPADAADARFALAVPFSSAYGLMILSACLLRSIPIVPLKRALTLSALYEAAQRHRVTHYEGSASIILLMEQTAGRRIPYDIGSLKYFGFGGSVVSGKTIEIVRGAYPGVELYQGYGMTEAAPLITKHPRGKLAKPDSVGTAIQGVDIAVDAGRGITHAPHVEGEIVVKGPNVMLGYFRDEAETSRALKDGYLHTGDIGYLDEDGDLYICGRKKNVIIVRGFNVHPEEVEASIQNSSLARDCRVYGEPDALGNEMVCADVVPSHPLVSADAISEHCRAHLAEFKRPHRITLCQSVNKNASGKTVRWRGDSR